MLKSHFVRAHEKKTEGKLRAQARPNVIFETGLALGAHYDKTLIVQVGDVKPFTDLAGMHILRLSNDQASRNDFARRLRKLGCKADQTGDHWLNAGNLEPAAPKKAKTKPKLKRQSKPKAKRQPMRRIGRRAR